MLVRKIQIIRSNYLSLANFLLALSLINASPISITFNNSRKLQVQVEHFGKVEQ